jgi:hypothetical protein
VVLTSGAEERNPKIVVDGRRAQALHGSLLSVSTSKTMGAPSGTWQITIKPSQTATRLFNQIVDDDWIDIVFYRHGRKWHVMRGIVDDVRRDRAVGGGGATTEVYTVTGRDFAKIWEVTPIWFGVFAGEPVTGGVSNKVFSGTNELIGSADVAVRGFLLGFLNELSGVGRAVWKPPPTVPNILQEKFIASLVFNTDGFSNKPPRVALDPSYMMPEGMLWNIAQEWSDPMFTELFADTLPGLLSFNPAEGVPINETELTLVFRDKPFPTLEKADASPYFSLPLHIIPRQMLLADSIGRSSMERFNAFFAAPIVSQETMRSMQDLHGPLWNPEEILRHGLRRFDVVTRYKSEDIVGLAGGQRTIARDWHCLNPYLLNGVLSLAIGQPQIHIGERVRIPGVSPDLDETYYTEQVSHSWTFGGSVRTSLGVTRGWIGTDSQYIDTLGAVADGYVLQPLGKSTG